MKKSKLIEVLNNIKGDPEILLWNGLVGDYMDINTDLYNAELVKHTSSFFRNFLKREEPNLTDEELDNESKTLAKKEEWSLPNRYVDNKLYKTWYGNRRKKVLILDALPRNKQSSDRLGTIEY